MAVPVLKDIDSIHKAEAEYYSRHGYFGRLKSLEDLLSGALANGEKDNYHFNVELTDHGYTITARAILASDRNYYSDQTLAVHYSGHDQVATNSSPHDSLNTHGLPRSNMIGEIMIRSLSLMLAGAGMLSAQPYDLVLRGGNVIDPATESMC